MKLFLLITLYWSQHPMDYKMSLWWLICSVNIHWLSPLVTSVLLLGLRCWWWNDFPGLVFLLGYMQIRCTASRAPSYNSYVASVGSRKRALHFTIQPATASASVLIENCTTCCVPYQCQGRGPGTPANHRFFCYNTTPHQSTGQSPFFLMFR